MKWSRAQDDILRQQYPTRLASEIAAQMGRTERAVRQRAAILQVRPVSRPPTNWRPIGTERFDKDKGTMLRKVTDTGNPKKDWKRVEVIEWEALHGPIPRGKVLAIKLPGLPRTPENMILVTPAQQMLLACRLSPTGSPLPLGSERVQSDGLLYRKVANTGDKWTDWKRAEVLDWEAEHGPIPEGHVLMLKDYSLPRTKDNLALFTRKEHFQRVGVHQMPEEIQGLYRLKAQITKAVNKLAKEPA